MLDALCGFSNFASLGIMIGGLGMMAPERREEINALRLKSIVSGTLTTCLMGAVVGVLAPLIPVPPRISSSPLCWAHRPRSSSA